MKILLAPSFLVVLMAVWGTNPVTAQQPRGLIPFVTEVIPSRAPGGAVIQLRIQYDGDLRSLKKYRLEIGGVTARFFLMSDDVPIASAVVPRQIKGEMPSPGDSTRVPIVFLDPNDAGGIVYEQFSFISPSSMGYNESIEIVNVTRDYPYFDLTFNHPIPVSVWGKVQVYINSKQAEIVKMEERVFTVALPDGVSSNDFQVMARVDLAESPVFKYGLSATATPTFTPAVSTPSSSATTVELILFVGVIILVLLFLAYYVINKRSKPSAIGMGGPSEYREILHLPTELPPDLIRACETGECVLYAGAGLSAQSGLPTWTPFVHGLLEWALQNNFIDKTEADEYHHEVNRGQADPVSDSLVSRLTTNEDRAALNEYLRSVFLKRTSPSALHERLQTIKFSAVLTTNFDNLLESVFRSELTYTPKDSESLLAALTRRVFFVLKLYGRLDQQDTVLVAPAQYNSAIRNNTLFSEFMQTLFFSGTILFLGASLEGIESYLQGIALPETVVREHYAVVAVTGSAWRAKADLLQRRYGIKVLPYTPSEDFTEVNEWVDRLAEEVSSVRSPVAVRGVTSVSKLKRITLNNIGPFENLSLELNSTDKEQWHVFLGDNGVGKSTVLKAIALALCGKDAQQYAGRLLRFVNLSNGSTGQTIGTITLETDRGTSYVTTIKRDDRTGQVELTSNTARPLEAEGWLAIGFPPLRTTSWEVTPKGPDADIKTTSRPVVTDLLPLVKGEVDPRLDKLKQWIVNLDYRSAKSRSGNNRAHEMIQKVFDIIGHVAEGMTLTYKGVGPAPDNRILVAAQDGALIPLEALSQGTISLMGWIGILVQRLYEVFGEEEDPTARYALVLMDEIDAHMHPLWQRILVTHLKEIFPNVQFIATTHSPLVIGGMSARQVVRFGKDKTTGKPVLLPVPPDATFGYTDQVLTSMLFDLPTSLDRTTEIKKIGFNELYQKNSRSPDEEEEYETLRQELIARVPPSGGSYAQKHAAQATEVEMLRKLAQNLAESSPEESEVLRKRADKLNELIGGTQSNDQN